MEELEVLTWTPEHGLSDREIDQFLVVARSVGTFARALDCSSSVKQPSLHMSAAAASRDITLVRYAFLSLKERKKLISCLSLFSFTPWILCTNANTTWERQCVLLSRQQARFFAGIKWKSGPLRRPTSLKKPWVSC